MKKVFSLMAAILLCFSFTVTASAKTVSEGVAQPLYDKASEAKSTLSISGTTATCKSTVDGKSDVKKIVAVQTLEKQRSLWSWDKYRDAEWTKTVNSSSLTMSNKYYNLESGTYSVKTVFTLTDSQGKSETITVYSDDIQVS